MKPELTDFKKETFSDFKKNNRVNKIIDTYEEQIKELFLIRNPRFRFIPDYQKEQAEFIKDHLGGKDMEEAGRWFYFPWNELLVHYLSDELHQELRTARNKNLITKEEQEKLYNFKIGIAGLSVGSHPALTLAMMGAGKTIKLADPDRISGSNLNRIKSDFTKIGEKKLDLVAEQIYQINPYAEIYQYPDGVNRDNVIEFLSGLDILIEEVDNLEMKILLRLEAKKIGIPVVMATDNGDNVIVDIERYDLDKNLEIFNGAAGHLTIEEFQKLLPQDLPKLSTKIAGPNLVVSRMQKSLLEVGKTLYSWPQLGDAATFSGAAVAYVVKRIALGEKVKTGKIEINLDSIFDPDYNEPEVRQEREKQREIFLKTIGF